MNDLTIFRPDGSEVLFTHAELCDRASGGGKLAPGFALALAMLRISLGKPMRVTSCCRTMKRNNVIGGHPHSLHIHDAPRGHPQIDGCAAIDIHTPDPQYARFLTVLALSTLWSVGVSKTFIHLDRRADFGLPQGVFGY